VFFRFVRHLFDRNFNYRGDIAEREKKFRKTWLDTDPRGADLSSGHFVCSDVILGAMNPTHLHLILTHVPVIGLGITIFVNFYAIITKSRNTSILTILLYVLLGLFAALAFITGDGAEKMLVEYPGCSEDIIEPHENAAMFFFLGLMLTAGAAIVCLLVKKNEQLLKKFTICLFIAAIAISFLAVKTALTGGAIRHPEIKNEGYYRQK
jgi:hypothetical protein